MSKFEFLLPQKIDSLTYGISDSPWGELFLVFKGHALYGLGIMDSYTPIDPLPYFERRLKAKLAEYDETQAKVLSDKIGKGGKGDLTCKVMGTPFQHQIWKALLQIPHGKTLTYSEIASISGNPKAQRAAGSAIGSNPISILIPCHRVLPKVGGVGNFLWGQSAKQRILKSEGINF